MRSTTISQFLHYSPFSWIAVAVATIVTGGALYLAGVNGLVAVLGGLMLVLYTIPWATKTRHTIPHYGHDVMRITCWIIGMNLVWVWIIGPLLTQYEPAWASNLWLLMQESPAQSVFLPMSMIVEAIAIMAIHDYRNGDWRTLEKYNLAYGLSVLAGILTVIVGVIFWLSFKGSPAITWLIFLQYGSALVLILWGYRVLQIANPATPKLKYQHRLYLLRCALADALNSPEEDIYAPWQFRLSAKKMSDCWATTAATPQQIADFAIDVRMLISHNGMCPELERHMPQVLEHLLPKVSPEICECVAQTAKHLQKCTMSDSFLIEQATAYELSLWLEGRLYETTFDNTDLIGRITYRVR